MSARVLVIGVGSPDRGDDGVGPVVAAEVAQRALKDVDVVTELTPVDLLDAWDGAALVVLVDAVRTGGEPGTVTVLDATDVPLPVGVIAPSTHGLGVADVVELARSLGRLPHRLVVVGVELADPAAGGLSEPVRAAVEQAVRTVVRLATAGAPQSPPDG